MKRCLVIGGSGALGRAVCGALAAKDARVALTYHAREATIPGAVAFQLDVASVANIDYTIDEAARALDGLDALVYCAGLGIEDGRRRLGDVDEAAWDRMMTVNARGAFFAARRAAEAMTGGNIVLVGSVDSVKPAPTPVHYVASKGALAAMAIAMAKELGPRGLRVNVVSPGILEDGVSRALPPEVREEYLKHSGLKRLGRVDEAAAVVAWFAIDNTYVTGCNVLLDGGL